MINSIIALFFNVYIVFSKVVCKVYGKFIRIHFIPNLKGWLTALLAIQYQVPLIKPILCALKHFANVLPRSFKRFGYYVHPPEFLELQLCPPPLPLEKNVSPLRKVLLIVQRRVAGHLGTHCQRVHTQCMCVYPDCAVEPYVCWSAQPPDWSSQPHTKSRNDSAPQQYCCYFL